MSKLVFCRWVLLKDSETTMLYGWFLLVLIGRQIDRETDGQTERERDRERERERQRETDRQIDR